MAIPSGVVVGWPSTAASIPAGWSRKTAWDTRYPRGAVASGDAGATGGAAVHSHSSPSHNSTQVRHLHSIPSGDDGDVATPATIDLFGGVAIALSPHTHTALAGSATPTNNGIAITVNDASNELAYTKLIWIESDGSPIGIPVGAVAFFQSDSLPTNWTRVFGNTYPRGADAAGDGGGTGGSITHVHTSPAHTHTQNSHTHSASAIGASVFANALVIGATVSTKFHSHTLTLSTDTGTNQSVTTTINSSNHEPVFKKINFVRNDGASSEQPISIVVIWSGTHGAIPVLWTRVIGLDDFFPKAANANGESMSTTGGSQTHTHTASNCQPIQNAHTHTVTNDPPAVGTTDVVQFPGGMAAAIPAHTHSGWTPSNTTPTNNAATVTISANTSESAYPPWFRAIFISADVAGGGTGAKMSLMGVGV